MINKVDFSAPHILEAELWNKNGLSEKLCPDLPCYPAQLPKPGFASMKPDQISKSRPSKKTIDKYQEEVAEAESLFEESPVLLKDLWGTRSLSKMNESRPDSLHAYLDGPVSTICP